MRAKTWPFLYAYFGRLIYLLVPSEYEHCKVEMLKAILSSPMSLPCWHSSCGWSRCVGVCLSAFSWVELVGLHLLLPAQPAGRGGAALPQQQLPLVALGQKKSAEGTAPVQVSFGVPGCTHPLTQCSHSSRVYSAFLPSAVFTYIFQKYVNTNYKLLGVKVGRSIF